MACNLIDQPYTCWWGPRFALRNGLYAGTAAGAGAALVKRSDRPVLHATVAALGVGFVSWFFFSGKWWR